MQWCSSSLGGRRGSKLGLPDVLEAGGQSNVGPKTDRDLHQAPLQSVDGPVVGVAADVAVGVHRLDGRFELVGPRRAQGRRLAHQDLGCGELAMIPDLGVLLGPKKTQRETPYRAP